MSRAPCTHLPEEHPASSHPTHHPPRSRPISQNPPSATMAIRLGVVAPMTGERAAFGQQVMNGAAAAVDKINAAGGVNGEKITLVREDDGADPKASQRPIVFSVRTSSASLAISTPHALSRPLRYTRIRVSSPSPLVDKPSSNREGAECFLSHVRPKQPARNCCRRLHC